MIADQIEGLSTIRFLEVVEEEIFALKGAKDRCVQGLFDWTSEAEQQRVRKIDDVGRRFIFDPVDKLVDLFALKSALTFQDGDGHLAERFRIRRERSSRREVQCSLRIPKPIEPARCFAKQRNVLFEVSTDTP